MAKRILLFLALLMSGSPGPGLPTATTRFVPVSAAVAWAQPEAVDKTPPCPLPAAKEETRCPEDAPQPPPPIPEAEKKTEKPGDAFDEMLGSSVATIDETHAKISESILATVDWFDSFFADERAVSECQQSHLKLSFSTFFMEKEKVRYDIRPNFRLELPVLKTRVNFLLAADEEEKEFQPAPLQGVRQEFLNTSRESFTASLRYFFLSTMERSLSVRVGTRFKGFMPTPFIEPRYRQTHASPPWVLRLNQRVIGLTNISVESRTTVDLDRTINEKILFRNTFDGSWFSENNGYFYSLQFTTFHRLSNRRVLEYQWNNFFKTSPDHNLEEIRLRVLFRQQLWRKWLFYEIAPQLTFPRERDYRQTPGILLRLEAIFGSYE